MLYYVDVSSCENNNLDKVPEYGAFGGLHLPLLAGPGARTRFRGIT